MRCTAAWLAPCLFLSTIALAQRAPYESALRPDSGKLPLTAGFNDIDGAGGGGLVPWATITSYGTASSFGANVHYTEIPLRDFRLRAFGAAVGVRDRFEISATRQRLDVNGGPLHGLDVEQDVYGAKLRLLGDAIYAQDSWLPQIAAGAQYKRNRGLSDGARAGAPGLFDVRQIGAGGRTSTDYYLAATKVFLAQSLLVNVTARLTQANQLGLLGFGAGTSARRHVEPEATLAYLITRRVAVGGEYRSKPGNLAIDDERDAWDVFVAWTPSTHWSLVAGYLNVGSVLSGAGTARVQDGAYLSLQVGL